MPSNIYLPQAGETVTEGRIQTWLKQEGDNVKEDEIICEVMTSKLAIEVKSPATGTVFRIFAPVDETVEVGKVIAVIQHEGESLDPDEVDKTPGRHKSATEKKAKKESVEGRSETPSKESFPQSDISKKATKEVFASPVARKIAEEHKVDLGDVTGTGPRGRITKEDVLEFVSKKQDSGQAAQDLLSKSLTSSREQSVTVTKMAGIRKIIAERMRESVSLKPHICFETRPRVDEILRIRKEMSELHDKKVSVNSMIMYFYVLMIRKFPMLNAHVVGEEIRQFSQVNLGMAVARPEGLIVPVLKNACSMSLLELDEQARHFSQKARDNKLSMDDLTGGTVTVSNLGMFGVRNFNAIINPPEITILAVSGIEDQCELCTDGKVVSKKHIGLNLCVDHSAVDGDIGASAVMYLKQLIENPYMSIFEK